MQSDIPIPTNAELGRAIRRFRKARHLLIDDLASDSEMHPTYLSGIERGIRNPSWEKLCGLAAGLKVPVSAIIQEAERGIPQDTDQRRLVALALAGT
jgi:transcriptional regulator with XRE-family HTH domain